MPNDLSTIGIVGTDGGVPVYEPNGRWCIWGRHEIYEGGPGRNRYVPKVKDYIRDVDTYETWIVRSIDAVTLIPTLAPISPATSSGALGENDILFGVGPGTQADTYRIYIDKSVMPYSVAVDARLKVGGSMTQYAQIFRGADVSDMSKIMSRIYDNTGHFLTHNVPLEVVAIDSHVNHSIKIVAPCQTNLNIEDGEVLTVVLFSADGHVVSKRQCLAENTSFIRQASASQKYITGIGLECPFISPTELSTIEFPLNVPVNSLNMIGVVNYSDGSVSKHPVDGTKFKMLGLQQYISSIIGQKFDLVLSYALSPGEAVYGAVSSDSKFVTAPYSIVTADPNNSYAVKLFGYPVWISEASGYSMNWSLFNLDRNIFFDVTPFVTFAENTGPFNPKGYGFLQQKAVRLNLRDVSGAFKPFMHTQMTDIILNGKPSDFDSPWSIINGPAANMQPYGAGVHGELFSADPEFVNLSSGFLTQEAWLENIYQRTYPLIDPAREIAVPEPTHFIVHFNGVAAEFPISEWSTNLDIGITIPNYSTVFIRFIKRPASGGDIQLAMAAIACKRSA